MRVPGISASILLIAVGAVLAWAVSVDTEGVNLNTVGVILFIVGIVGLVATFALTASATEGGVRTRERTIVDRDV